MEQVTGRLSQLFDPRPAIYHLQAGDTSAWEDLWNHLHHQGDIDLASYAAVPYLVAACEKQAAPDWNPYALLGVIERQQGQGTNPDLPEWLAQNYWAAWSRLPALGCADLARTQEEATVLSILGVLALAKGLRAAASVLLDFTTEEMAEMIRQYRGE